jgi:aquaporin Z
MIAAGVFVTLLEYPGSPLRQALPDGMLRRMLIGVAMGLTASSIVYSPLGKRSGAHFNPAVTLTFWRLGKIAPWDALCYIAAQFAGAAVGVALVAGILGNTLADPAVNYVVTIPGPRGPGIAFLAETLLAFTMMTVVLAVSNTQSLARFTGLFAGALVATFISLEAPISGMSINPARTFGSALRAQIFTSLWIYFAAPSLGMMLAAQVRLWVKGARHVRCAKLHHDNSARCIFCAYQEARKPQPVTGGSL